MKVHFINVGYGEAILVQSEENNILIDAGSGRKEAYKQPGTITAVKYLQAIGVTRLDVMIITHIHDDHIGGAAAVAMQIPVGEIWLGVVPDCRFAYLLKRIRRRVKGKESGSLFWYALKGYEQLMKAAHQKSIPVHQVFNGEYWQVGEIPVKVFGPSPERARAVQQAYEIMAARAGSSDGLSLYYTLDKSGNADSLAVLIGNEVVGALLTGDKVGGWQEIAARRCLHTPVLKVSHHGQKDGMPQILLAGADPDIVVICTDAGRTFNSAHPEVISRAESYLNTHERPPRVYVTGSLLTPHGLGSALVINAHREGENPANAEIWSGGGSHAGA